ncbi:flagellar hook protein FlgE [Rhodovarius crocodyli]|uniref:Flagellar hook protein FlgE n=1 Tax=Rhodovarius crocodyli TaxID=1979269 RepID=A0A437MDD7_9PROT|nr:flagellar hook protein FlgE [Rhodovarius crocodyli]RVT95658.1 flagellar hook protein FlgE [Rhodovarius crocodyli]
MSLFGAMNAAISGLSSQSKSLANISNNLANSQTVGYKRIDTNFMDLVTQSSRTANAAGSVVARPDYTNTIQGTITQSDNTLALAISGQGFFSVASQNGTVNGQPTFDDRQFYTRAGDFSLNSDGYMVNSQGYFLQGWPIDATTGEPNRTQLNPIRVSQQVFNPVATSSVELTANLPAGSDSTVTTQVQIYDSLGTAHTATLSFTPVTGSSEWDMSISLPDETTATTRTVRVQFGNAATPATTSGLLGSFASAVGVTPSTSTVTGDPATLTFTTDFGEGAQSITLNLGEIGQSTGLTQYSGTEFSVSNISQNGVPPGSYSGLSIGDNGDVTINYDNGQSRVISRIPVVTFSNPDALQRLDGQAFMRTPESGEARVTQIGSDGAGKLVVGSVEASNVDIATEFSKLIVAQRAYTANTKVVTASDEMLQDTINMSR